MKWYIVENHLDRKEALVAARVPYTELTITKPAITGLAFPEEELARVRELIRLPEKFEEVKTDQAGVFLLKGWVPRVVLESSSNMERWSEIEPVLQEYAEIMELDIVASNPHGNQSTPRSEERKLFLRFYSAPSVNDQVSRPYAFGIRMTDGQNDGVSASGEGILISDDQDTSIAEVTIGTLYVLFDLPHGPNAGKLMRAIMERYMLLQMNPEELERWQAEAAERERQKTEKERKESKAAYVRECGRRLGRIREETKKGIRDTENSLEAASRQIVELTRRLENLRLKQAQIEESNKAMEEKFSEEYEKLLQVPKVRRVKVADGIVSVFTDTVFLEHDGKTWELGDYRIDIYTNGTLKIVNTRVRELSSSERFHHPHVFERDGSNVCLGNIRDGVMRLIGMYEYSVAAQILVEFLHTMTRSSQYIGHLYNYWKPLEEKRKEAA